MSDQSVRSGAAHVILCADDYAMSAGVCDGILELAERQRLSATSAIVTLERWPQDARRVAQMRDQIAVGLHINLTLGAPLGAMPTLAPDRRLPSLGALLTRALTGRVDRDEVAQEVARQLAHFEQHLGFPPDHVDGHQHVHALPGVREGVLAALAARFGGERPLVRDPADSVRHIRGRGHATGKALLIALLGRGFGRAAHARGFPVNTSFSGFSSFDRRQPYADELAKSLSLPGRRHLVMCHPGHADAALAALDPVVARRADEYDAIQRYPDLLSLIWRPARRADGAPVNWEQA